GVECQQVGLGGDISDHADNRRHLPRALTQLLNGTRRAFHRACDLADLRHYRGDDLATLTRELTRTLGQAVRLSGIEGDMFDTDRHFLHRRSHAAGDRKSTRLTP